MVVLDWFFSFERQKKWLLVALDKWSSYTVTTVWEFAWVDSALVDLDKWSSYRGGCLNRFDSIYLLIVNNNSLKISLIFIFLSCH